MNSGLKTFSGTGEAVLAAQLVFACSKVKEAKVLGVPSEIGEWNCVEAQSQFGEVGAEENLFGRLLRNRRCFLKTADFSEIPWHFWDKRPLRRRSFRALRFKSRRSAVFPEKNQK